MLSKNEVNFLDRRLKADMRDGIGYVCSNLYCQSKKYAKTMLGKIRFDNAVAPATIVPNKGRCGEILENCVLRGHLQ